MRDCILCGGLSTYGIIYIHNVRTLLCASCEGSLIWPEVYREWRDNRILAAIYRTRAAAARSVSQAQTVHEPPFAPLSCGPVGDDRLFLQSSLIRQIESS